MRLDGVKKVSHPTNAGALVTHDPFFGNFRLALSERAEKLQSHLFVKGSLLYLYSQPAIRPGSRPRSVFTPAAAAAVTRT